MVRDAPRAASPPSIFLTGAAFLTMNVTTDFAKAPVLALRSPPKAAVSKGGRRR
ncbi:MULTISPECIES: hypothetical protein [unclassified Bradyrhizobium]|uniref:hypothetical protein n=1 Tax=unclassified Bradyrhizobium TaxID=2631580 RepID=UPI0028E1C3D9|nr:MULTISPECIES: hypothetical protein [unclassified Bradyrhizobium]